MKTLSILTLILFQFSAAQAATDCKSEESYPLITKTELKTVADSKAATIIDVNSKSSYKEAHVPGAIHFDAHKQDFAKQLPADKSALIVAYCGGPQCTAWLKAAKEACQLGYTNIKHFKEGISGWKKI